MALKLTLGFETAPGSATNFHGVEPLGSGEMNSWPTLLIATHSDTDGHVRAEGFTWVALAGADQVNAVGVGGTLVEVVLVGSGLVVLVGAVVVVEIGFGPLLV
jgi:hypothetical protein